MDGSVTFSYKIISYKPSGMSHATTAISARNHSMRFVMVGYSALQCSAKCFPTINVFSFYNQLKHKTE